MRARHSEGARACDTRRSSINQIGIEIHFQKWDAIRVRNTALQIETRPETASRSGFAMSDERLRVAERAVWDAVAERGPEPVLRQVIVRALEGMSAAPGTRLDAVCSTLFDTVSATREASVDTALVRHVLLSLSS